MPLRRHSHIFDGKVSHLPSATAAVQHQHHASQTRLAVRESVSRCAVEVRIAKVRAAEVRATEVRTEKLRAAEVRAARVREDEARIAKSHLGEVETAKLDSVEVDPGGRRRAWAGVQEWSRPPRRPAMEPEDPLKAEHSAVVLWWLQVVGRAHG